MTVPEMLMPRLSESMADGVIVRWLREPGTRVEQGEDLVEIETDKATVTCEAESTGLLQILAGPGDTLAVGVPIARIGAPATPDVRFKASPLARRLARENGVDLVAVRGSGPGGRIVRADVLAEARQSGETGGEPAHAPGGARGAVTVVEATPAQQTIAERMTEAKRTIPEFVLGADIDMEACAELRARIEAATGAAPTYNDMVVKAVALALRDHPRANGAYREGSFHLYGRVNIGIAVATEDALLVPTVFDADTRTLTDIASTTRSLAERVRDGRITPAELDGGTFTVSNLGAYCVDEFTAVINPPQAAILALGAVARRPRIRDGELSRGRTLRATLTCDHRILNGADAAGLLSRVAELLAEPLTLLLEEGSPS